MSENSHPQRLKERIDLSRFIKDLILISMGIASATLGLKGFLLPNGFIDGGVTGISLLVAQLTHWPLPWLIVLINMPFFYLAYRQVSKIFAIKTVLSISMLALCLALVEFPVLTQDRLLIAVFGGFFLGGGIGLCIRGGSVIDGTEILALYLSRKLSITIGDVIMIINVIIFSFAALLLGLDHALYSMLTYLAASKNIDFIIHGIEEFTGVTIISERSEEIRAAITEKMGRGVTIYRGKRGFGKRGERNHDIDIVFTVVTRLELPKLKNEVDAIDPGAFLIQHSINDTRGGMIKKRPLH